MPQWDSQQYLQFARERTQPSIDLVQRIPLDNPRRIIDIGCGPGNSTQVLVQRYPHAAVIGLDNSPEMIARARADYPNLEWRLEDASAFAEQECYDIVFSNAAFQWIPRHEELLPRLFAAVKPGGVFAFQVPGNFDSPLHQSIRRTVLQPEWAPYFPIGANMFVYLSLPFYYDLLAPLAATVDLWETTYYHLLASHQALLEWYRGTGLRPFLESLPDETTKRRFEEDVLEGCRAHYPLQQNGALLFPFRRLFCLAQKG